MTPSSLIPYPSIAAVFSEIGHRSWGAPAVALTAAGLQGFLNVLGNLFRNREGSEQFLKTLCNGSPVRVEPPWLELRGTDQFFGSHPRSFPT